VSVFRSAFLFLTALAAVAALVTAGCGNSPGSKSSPVESVSPASGVAGVTLEEGGPPPGDPRPLPGVKVEVHAGDVDGPITALVQADENGLFRVALPPGRYTFIVHQYDDRLRQPTTVTVAAGVISEVRVLTDVR
jgi:hypothetical protein